MSIPTPVTASKTFLEQQANEAIRLIGLSERIRIRDRQGCRVQLLAAEYLPSLGLPLLVILVSDSILVEDVIERFTYLVDRPVNRSVQRTKDSFSNSIHQRNTHRVLVF